MVEKELSAKKVRRVEKEIVYILGFVALLVVIYLLAAAYFRSLAQIEYRGLHFTKEKEGELDVYRYYYYNTNYQPPRQYNLYLLNDPRKNNVSIEGGPVLFHQNSIYVSIDTSYPSNCSDNIIGVVDLTRFLVDNKMKVTVGIANETYALENNQKYISCVNKPSSEVIEFVGGNETKIVVDGNCHRIVIGPECQNREAVEKFKVEVLAQAKEQNVSFG